MALLAAHRAYITLRDHIRSYRRPCCSRFGLLAGHLLAAALPALRTRPEAVVVAAQAPAMAQLPADTTSLQVPSEADGLPDASDRVVRELDVHLVNGELGSATQVRRACWGEPPPPPPLPPPPRARQRCLPACLAFSLHSCPVSRAADVPAAVPAAPALAAVPHGY